jgi:hypothetical protein
MRDMPGKVQNPNSWSHWEQDPSTGLFILRKKAQPLAKPTKKQLLSSFTQAKVLSAAHERVSLDPRVPAAIQKKIIEAFASWAFMKMGLKRVQYLQEAYRDFGVQCALIVANTNRDIGEVAEEVPFEFPLQLNKTRTAFTQQIFDLLMMASEYEAVCEIVVSAKKNQKTAAQFRIVLRDKLEQFASQQKLQPVPRKELGTLLENYHLRTLPSDIALDYVGFRRKTSGTNIKKRLVVARDPNRMDKLLKKYLKKAYLPKNFKEIMQSLVVPK